ncbi:hydroxymethylcytosylglucuronate/cytosylglucuronate synthase [Streptomyces griseocarneus]|uniref:hydroxymethylcytosylglucuronate/cytosylglucurona te synthase n=1 Tax=Streptomyces griseocarneus TaxID=51201 RepID=UPI00325A98A1
MREVTGAAAVRRTRLRPRPPPADRTPRRTLVRPAGVRAGRTGRARGGRTLPRGRGGPGGAGRAGRGGAGGGRRADRVRGQPAVPVDRGRPPLSAARRDRLLRPALPELPPECQGILASIPRLRWVEAIVGTPPVPRAGGSTGRPCRKVVVSLGGLRAPRLADWTSYPRLVVPAVLEALAAHGVRDVRLTGNLSAGLLADFVGRSPLPLRVTAGALPHAAFLAELAGCDALLTSPGLTTLLEAGSLGVPTLCLPPQNLSQIFNARFQRQAVGADVQVTWPADVLREDDVLAMRAKGEDHALELIYEAIGRAAARADAERVVAALSDRILAALRHTAEPADWGALATAVGTGGAAQVADAVLAAAGQSPPSS